MKLMDALQAHRRFLPRYAGYGHIHPDPQVHADGVCRTLRLIRRYRGIDHLRPATCSPHSFSVPYMSPMAPFNYGDQKDTILQLKERHSSEHLPGEQTDTHKSERKESGPAMRSRRPVRCSILLLTTALALTGCWDRNELNELAITVGMGIDKSGKNVHISTQIVNPGEVASASKGAGYTAPITTLGATEATTYEAIQKLSTLSPRKIYSSHLRVLVIGEQLARQGVKKVMDSISRDHEFRSDFYILIAKNTTAEQVLKILTPLERIPGNKLYATLQSSEKIWAPTVTMQLDQFVSDLSNPSKGTVLTAIRILGDARTGERKMSVNGSTPSALLKYSGLAILKKDRLVDWMNEEESKGYNYIMGNVKRSAGHIRCPDGGVMAVEVERTKSKIKAKIVKGKPKITVDLFTEEGIGEDQCKIDITKPKNITLLEGIAKEKLSGILEAAIRKAQKNKTDIFGFCDAVEDVSPKTWLRLKKDWDDYFADLDVTVRVNLQLRRFGTTSDSLETRKEK